MTNTVIDLLEQLRKTCATGRNYGNHPYDVTRYVEMLGLIDQLYARMTTANLDQIDPMDTTGYVTPKVGINGVVKREDGCILLEQREDDERWGIPGGWAEVGLTAEENMKKGNAGRNRLCGFSGPTGGCDEPQANQHLSVQFLPFAVQMLHCVGHTHRIARECSRRLDPSGKGGPVAF